MNPLIGLVVFAILVLVLFFVIRHFVKLQFPNLGRLSSAAIIVAGTVLDQLNALPWGQILTEAQAKLVGFTLLLGMGLIHAYNLVKQQIAPPPPPAP